MATRKLFASSILLVMFCLVIRNNVVMASHSLYNSGDESCIRESFNNKRLVARDVIQLTIHDIQNLDKFVNGIPRLKSFGKTIGQLPELNDCVAGLLGHITIARQTLSKIRRLDDKTMLNVLSESKQLQNVMNEAVELQGLVCYIALKDLDRTITSMLSRKLLDVAVTINDGAYLVYELHLQSPDHASTVANP